MRRRATHFACVASSCPVVLVLASTVLGSHEGAVQVSQPIVSADYGAVVSDVTYMCYGYSYDNPSFEASLTVVPNSISTPQGWENRNGAAAIGIRLDFPRGERALGLFGDTLRVVVDLTALQDTSKTIWDVYEPDIVAATMECLKLNARRPWPMIRFLAIEIRGADEYQSHSGTYALESISCAPRARQVIADRPRAGEQE